MTGISTYSESEIFDLAKRQKAIIWLIAIFLAADLSSLVVIESPFLSVIRLLLLLTRAILMYQFAARLKEASPWIYAVVGIIPYLGLFGLGFLNSRAVALLRSAGLSVGIMGVSPTAALSAPVSVPLDTTNAPLLPKPTIEQRLRCLEGLRCANLITDSDYETHKAAILREL